MKNMDKYGYIWINMDKWDLHHDQKNDLLPESKVDFMGFLMGLIWD